MDKIKIPAEYYNQNDSVNTCYLCERPRYTKLYHVTHYGLPFNLSKCECGLVKQTPMPNTKFFDWFFNSDLFFSSKKEIFEKKKNKDKGGIWGYYDCFTDEPCRLETSKYRYKKLSYVFESGKKLKIMKIGPATGTMLYVAKQHGHEVLGSDISSTFSQFAKDQYDVQIDTGPFEVQNYIDEQFDVILLLNVIENIPNQVEVLNEINRTLSKNGYFIFNYVDMKNNILAKLQGKKYFLFRPPICYIYDRLIIPKIMKKFGFKIVKTHLDVRVLHLEKILMLLGWNKLLQFAQFLRIQHFKFKIYAYPSKIVVTQKI